MALKEEGNRLFKVNISISQLHICSKIYEPLNFPPFFQEGDVKAARDVYSKSLVMYPLRREDPANSKEYSVILANREPDNSGIIKVSTHWDCCPRIWESVQLQQ